jgi:pyridoxal 5'-phosphate synthase pdxT subunit
VAGSASPVIGILALQGDYAAHAAAIARLGATPRLVRTAADLAVIAGLILPGGESTTMLRLLERAGLEDAVRDFTATRPTFGTCAGVILLARDVTEPQQRSFGVLDVDVARNGYGRQVDSFVGEVEITSPPIGAKIEGVFIRAPRIGRVGPGVTVLGQLAATGEPVLVAQGHLLGATFHPELTADPRVHRLFLACVAGGAEPWYGPRATPPSMEVRAS